MQPSTHEGYQEPVSVAGETKSLEPSVLFLLDGQQYALRLSEVERIIRSVEVRPVPDSRPHIAGVVNMHGEVIPVVDLRVRFGQPSRDVRLEDHFIVARTASGHTILPVDAALTSMEIPSGSAPEGDDPLSRCLREVVPLDAGVVYVLDLDRVVAGEECRPEPAFAFAPCEFQSN